MRQKFSTARLCQGPVAPVDYKTREKKLEQPSKGSSLPPLRRDTMILRSILTSSSHKEAGATVESEISLAGWCVECLSPHGGATFEIREHGALAGGNRSLGHVP